ncbi:DUF4153 domain-containing protein [Microvirga terricola]|uniref:DUF4173 domain-containing protein n=1 Tax=Microvirga terricola TaxID=2719797 RepID=A0ABX0VBJ6_9HYPH|nr:DUF4173 domain-containing protein [Microvirga terricola]NIX76355.1 DUF4173 domain-containing protein [Microvirga terricola]
MTAALNADTTIPPHSRFSSKLAIAAAIAAIGDRLFYGHAAGLSLVLFLTLLATGSFLMRPQPSERRNVRTAAPILLLALLPLVEATGMIALLFGILGTALAAVVMTGGLTNGWDAVAISTRRLLLKGAFQLFPDLLQTQREFQSQGRKWLRLDVLVGWVVPILCGAVFTALFASANPLIEQWLAVFDVSRQSWDFDVARALFWGALLMVAWPFLSVRLCERRVRQTPPTTDVPRVESRNLLLGPATIQRSLVLFNALFAVQTVLDAMYLWGGAALPQGMTYATYAHRGAYPLIVTALLAAAFVLAAMRPGGAGEQSPLIRRLVYIWVGQNVLLVISSILRLDLYVEVYSLTHLRIAAFIWMSLVAVGLVLIMVRIALRRSNGWLVGANALALALTLYACSLINFTAMIANYNLSYKREAVSGATSPDLIYLRALGPHAIPALDRYVVRRGLMTSHPLVQWRKEAALAHIKSMDDWRAWAFRDWRLQRYLDRRVDAKEGAIVTPERPSNP